MHITTIVVPDSHRPAQLPRVGFVLFLDKKNKKSSQQIGFFAAQAFALQIGQNHGLQKLAPLRSLIVQPFCKYLLCPCSRTSRHVLPIFVRSLPADGNFFIDVKGKNEASLSTCITTGIM